MLREVESVVLHDNEPRKCWFTSPYFDLIVWFDGAGRINGFELCYDKPKHERVCCWSEESGYKHRKVDDGEHEPLHYKMTPIYLPDGVFDKSVVIARFQQEAAAIEPAIRDYVVDKLVNFKIASGSRKG